MNIYVDFFNPCKSGDSCDSDASGETFHSGEYCGCGDSGESFDSWESFILVIMVDLV